MILFLDDSRARINYFRSKVPNATIVMSAQKCIEKLSRGDEYEILFLDHDLGGEVYVDSHSKNSGMEVVRWIESHNPIIKQIIVHSHNYYAAQDMVDRLRKKKYKADAVPYTILKEKIKDFIL